MSARVPRALAIFLCLTASLALAQATKSGPKTKPAAPTKPAAAGFHVPVDSYKLPNGLRVVLSEDHTAPTAVLAVYYNIGFRIEPQDRTGFAHLFEHMMFEGSQNAPKGVFDKLTNGNGGVNNGSTRFDFTNYFEVVPSNLLETVLWLEADRMRGLLITEENLKNQQGVVMNEVKVNVLNQPYGGFPWLDMPQYANSNWYNAHNFYGELKDLEAANLEDVKKFFDTYYAPNNAALVVVGDFNAKQTKEWIAKHFGDIKSGPPIKTPDISEPRQEKEKRAKKIDLLAKRPALAIAYHVPQRNSPEYFAMAILDQLLVQGNDSLLRQELVKKRGYTAEVEGGINLLGNAFNYNGPMLWTASLIHDAEASPEKILEAVDAVIEPLRTKPIDQQMLDLARVKLRSSFYDSVGEFNGFGRADLLASFALFDDNPARINALDAEFAKVTPDTVLKAAREYLRPSNRTVLVLEPGAEAAPKGN
ncbi:MAG TPA: pitrilysin family protein [Terriglobales bacterium]|jgi:predicted Zn-dependent peptidase|nr:pitrilysin family protein [Terriglobales bacterium]